MCPSGKVRLAREARKRGELVLAGALAEPVDRALLVFHVDNKGKVEAFARKDPYVVNGLAKKWEVRPWNVVVGNADSPSSLASASSDQVAGTILRCWSARTTEAQLPKYLEHFSKNVLPELRRVPGYLGATVSLRRLESEVEIVVETNWRSLESIRKFASPDLEAAVVADDAAALLTDFDRRVRHYEIAVRDVL
jgi:heme-degrading monooxygenase HmoA